MYVVQCVRVRNVIKIKIDPLFAVGLERLEQESAVPQKEGKDVVE